MIVWYGMNDGFTLVNDEEWPHGTMMATLMNDE